MELKDVILQRRSIRHFQKREVPCEVVLQLLRLASWAPSANNRQQWFFYAIHSFEKKEAIAQAVEAKVNEMENWSDLPATLARSIPWWRRYVEMIREAPWLIVFCQEIHLAPMDELLIKRGLDWEKIQHWRPNAGLQSVAATIENFLLAVQDHGLGACWMVGPLFAVEEMEEILQVPENRRIVTIVPLGYPAESPEPPKRKPEEETWLFIM